MGDFEDTTMDLLRDAKDIKGLVGLAQFLYGIYDKEQSRRARRYFEDLAEQLGHGSAAEIQAELDSLPPDKQARIAKIVQRGFREIMDTWDESVASCITAMVADRMKLDTAMPDRFYRRCGAFLQELDSDLLAGTRAVTTMWEELQTEILTLTGTLKRDLDCSRLTRQIAKRAHMTIDDERPKRDGESVYMTVGLRIESTPKPLSNSIRIACELLIKYEFASPAKDDVFADFSHEKDKEWERLSLFLRVGKI